MNTPNPEWIFRQLGYAPARTNSEDILRTVGLVAAGVVVGAAVVALFTPKSGPELRTSISEGAGQLKSAASTKATALKGQISEKAQSFRTTADGIRERAEEELQNV